MSDAVPACAPQGTPAARAAIATLERRALERLLQGPLDHADRREYSRQLLALEQAT